MPHTVKRLIGDDLFGEIGKFKKFAKISRRQITISYFLDSPVLEIAKLILCQIVICEKTPNIIATKYSRFTEHILLHHVYSHMHNSCSIKLVI